MQIQKTHNIFFTLVMYLGKYKTCTPNWNVYTYREQGRGGKWQKNFCFSGLQGLQHLIALNQWFWNSKTWKEFLKII